MKGQTLCKLLRRIDRKKEQLDACRPLTPGEAARLRDEFLVDFTYNSNAIEGNTLTLQETAMVLEGITIDQRPLKDHLEAIGHRDAFRYMQKLVSEQTLLSERVIKELHSLVLMDRPEDRGRYRRIPVRIMGAAVESPEPHLVASQMEQLLRDNERRQSEHVIERIAWFHLTFEGIHPFVDGNGRTGRLLLNFDLMQHGYPPINVKFTDRRRYYNVFDAYFRNNDILPMTSMIGEYLEERLDRYLDVHAKIHSGELE